MKKLKIKWWDDFSDFICFEANLYQNEYIFLEIKNFKTESISLPIQRHYLELDNKHLNLKQFKMEIF